jgi:signal transduction histidine kinase
MGELCVSGTEGHEFSKRQADLLTGLADLAAITVENARLLDKERYAAVLEERERLSRELHDSLAQVLAYLHLKAQGTLRLLSEEKISRAQDELRDMIVQAHEAYVDVREAILDLRESLSPNSDFVSTLQGYLHKFSRQSGIPVELEVIDPPVPGLSRAAEVQLLRVIQEALTNVRKHAQADKAHVRLRHDERTLTIAVEDDGQGFEVEALEGDDGRTFGLATMRERVERAGGEFSIDSAPRRGTRIQVIFPRSEVYR